MTDLSGRIDSIETQLTFLSQDLLQKIDITTLSQSNSIWNQQYNELYTVYTEVNRDLQELQVLYTNLVLAGLSGSSSVTGAYLSETFETISKNLKQYGSSIYYSGEYISQITYEITDTTYINKYINYDLSGYITSIYISGNPSLNINSTKYFYYSGSYLTGTSYS